MLCVDTPGPGGRLPLPGWYFEAGPQRCAVPYAFLIGPDDSFGIAGGDDDRWIPLHASIEGWIESLALAYAAADIADTVTRLTGRAVDEIDLTAMQPMMEVERTNRDTGPSRSISGRSGRQDRQVGAA
jgi:hypothetical protein